MEVRNCRKCKRLFNYLGGKPYCPECKDALERDFLKVRDYIRDNPTDGIQEIADACEVEAIQIRDWIKEGRLEVTVTSGITLTCEKCGEKILKGRFCDKCNQKMADSLGALVTGKEIERKKPVDPAKIEQGMRFKRP